MHGFEFWGWDADAEREGLSALEKLRRIDSGSGNVPKKEFKALKNKYVPVFPDEGELDHDLAGLVVDIVVTLVKCVDKNQSKKEGDYRRVIDLVRESVPWFSVLEDANAREKSMALVKHLDKCILFLVGELMNFSNDLVQKFWSATVAAYSKSVIKDQLQELTRRICSSLFSVQCDQSSSIFDILKCVLDSMASECKVEMGNTISEYIELVEYCANQCRTVRKTLCSQLAAYLTQQAKSQVLPPFDILLRLFATGLLVSDRNNQSRQDSSTTTRSKKDGSGIAFLLVNEDLLHDLETLVENMKCYFHTTKKAISAEHTGGSVHQIDSHIKPSCDTSSICQVENGKQHLPLCLNALKFLCQPLAKSVNSEKDEILAETEGASCATKLINIIQDALHQLIVVFNSCPCTFERKSNDFDDYGNTILSVAVAALTLSFKTKLYRKESTSFIKRVITLEWIQFIQANSIEKYIAYALYNVGATLYRNRQLKEASVAVKLCCRAWGARVSYLCESFSNKSNSFCTDMSEDAVMLSVGEACDKTARALNLLYLCGSHNKLSKTMSNCLEKWCVAENLFDRLPSPVALVKKWVQLECKLCEENTERVATTLYSLMSSSKRVSVRPLVIILEQELLAYEDLSPSYPSLCKKVQMDIRDVLIGKVYVADDKCLQNYKFLIAKGRVLRASGIEGLKGCIECLSNVISTMDGMKGGEVRQCLTSCHQLAVAHCLRAVCIHEDEPNSEKPFEDIQAAVDLWLRFDYFSVDNQHDLARENMLILLYHVIDILSMKGITKFHPALYKLLIRLFERKNVALEKCFASLWQYRRCSHALCASPVSEEFITTFSQHCGELSENINFWKSSMSGSLPLEVGFQQSFTFTLTNFSHGSCNIKVDEIKKVALDLTSKDPVSSSSIFLAAHLYHDLCAIMVSTGRIIEALSYAQEAFSLRYKLFKKEFKYTWGKQSEIYDENGAITQKHRGFQMTSRAATTVWNLDKISSKMEGCLLTPWNLLQCYLESILQVGIIDELIGDGSEAKRYLLEGKRISSFQDLPLFEVAFSSVLAWDLAEKELNSAKQILAHWCGAISCTKCISLFEVTIDLLLGDLTRSRPDEYKTGKLSVYAENLYTSAFDKLNLSVWKNSVSCHETVGFENTTICDAVGMNHSDVNEFPSKAEEPEVHIEAKRAGKTKKVAEPSSRMTRSRYRSQKNDNIPCDKQVGHAMYSKNGDCFVLPDALSQGEFTCDCNNLKCWYCLRMEVLESGCIKDFVHMKWELTRRRLLLKLLTGIGKCLGDRGKIHEAREFCLQSILVLVSRNLFLEKSSIRQDVLLDMVGKEIPGDPLTIERATVLYNLCWFTLKSYTLNDTSTLIPIPTIMSWLMLAFVLCREVPLLVQKVSRLLAAIFVLSSSTPIFSSYVSPWKALSESHWASYFHEASIGTHFNIKLRSTLIRKQKVQGPINVEGFCLPGSSYIASETLNLLRLAPESFVDLEDYVQIFFKSLPCTSIVGLSLLEGAVARLLSELMGYPSEDPAWILFSRLHSDCQPVVLLLMVDSILEEATDDNVRSVLEMLPEDNSFANSWRCLRGSNVIDGLAPDFKRILEEDYKITSKASGLPERYTLDRHLKFFLRNLEDLWFGPWKFLLPSGFKQQESVLSKLVHNLKDKCNVDAQEGLLKVIVGGAKYARNSDECILKLILGKGCFIGYSNQTRCSSLSAPYHEDKSLSKRVFKLAREAYLEVDEEDRLNNEPVILVLDFDVQMLPWESLPVLRKQEVYRMPSIGSIFATLDRCCQFQGHHPRNASFFPLIDPLNCFYLLDPNGIKTQHRWKKFIREKNLKLKGWEGPAPKIEDLALALRSHDLFIYCGHGDGMQFIPRQEIEVLQKCAASLLMGCNSGSLHHNGSYAPWGAPLSYLLAGSPAIVATLWIVEGSEIDLFAQTVLNRWLEERPRDSIDCVQCNLLAEKLNNGNAKKKTSTKNVVENFDKGIYCNSCKHSRMVGASMAQARDVCKLPFLTGAAVVCFGVPTGIRKKRDL